MQQVDGRKARGDESRRIVLARAINIASVQGLAGLSIGRLASDVSASKSGVAALFGSKEQLQLATIAAAREVFTSAVIEPARTHPRGIHRVCALVQLWLDYSSGRVFEGGCFFMAASVELDSKPGPVRDALIHALDDWDGYLAAAVRHAMEQGELPGLTDAAQLAFEINALFDEANTRSLLRDSRTPYDRARAAIMARLLALGADPAVLAQHDRA